MVRSGVGAAELESESEQGRSRSYGGALGASGAEQQRGVGVASVRSGVGAAMVRTRVAAAMVSGIVAESAEDSWRSMYGSAPSAAMCNAP
jgi:hypothetical protein